MYTPTSSKNTRKLGGGLVQRVSIEHVLFALIVRAAYLYLVSNDYKRAAGWSICAVVHVMMVFNCTQARVITLVKSPSTLYPEKVSN